MRKNFEFYGYCSPTSGKYYVDGNEYFMGEDFRTAKRYKEYKDVGFTILLLQHENSYSGEDFETSACNLCMREAVKAGIDKIIVSDTRLKELCEEETLVGESGKFKTASTMVGLCVWMVFPGVSFIGTIVMWMIVITTVYSGVEYFIQNWNVLWD